ncbi:MAG: glycoside hydrolase family 43 protein [Candidatus Dormibacteria bacterium]
MPNTAFTTAGLPRLTHVKRISPRQRYLLMALLGALAVLIPVAAFASGEARHPAAGPFADPEVVAHDGIYDAFGTSRPGAHVPVVTSPDLSRWSTVERRGGGAYDALPQLGTWTSRGSAVWAPAVTPVAPGRWVMFYTSHAELANQECIGAAVATTPRGPYHAESRPIVCIRHAGGAGDGGAIDPSVFVDGAHGGRHYLLWKNDGNSLCGSRCHITTIWIQELSRDGLAVLGGPRPLMDNDRKFEGRVVEAPKLVYRHGHYVLFFSDNRFDTARYSIGYATSSGLFGRYQEAARPLVSTANMNRGRSDDPVGPGGEDVVTDSRGQDHLVFAAHMRTRSGLSDRYLYTIDLNWAGDRPVAHRG